MTKRKAFTNPRCHAHRKNGDQCRKLAMDGTTVCRSHGGAAPSTRAKARERILAAADPAVATIVEIMFNPRAAAPVRLAAARDLLDRADLGGRSVVEIAVDIDPAVLALVAETRDRQRSALAAELAPHGHVAIEGGMDDVVDAELADDDEQDGYIDLDLEEVES